MKKSKVTRSLLAAVSVVALTAVMYGCTHDGDDPPTVDPATIDTDGDGVADVNDAFPMDPDETADSDEDGVGDNADAFPDDPDETADADGDGIGDNADPHNVLNDRDNDGVADSGDDFPDDPKETRDSDGDGVGDNADAFPNDPDETADSDGDGVGDNAQAEAARVAAIAATTKEAGTKATAIQAENDQTTDAGLGGTGTPATSGSQIAGEYNLAIEYGSTSITVEGATAAADEKYMLAADLGGGTTMHTRTHEADSDGDVVTEVAIVSTDIEAPKATAFAMVAGQMLDRTATGGSTAAGDNPFVALAVEAGDVAHVA